MAKQTFLGLLSILPSAWSKPLESYFLSICSLSGREEVDSDHRVGEFYKEGPGTLGQGPWPGCIAEAPEMLS